MSGVLDVFRGDAYTVMELTDAINKLPYIPNFLGSLGLFQGQGITTTTALIEERHGVLTILKFSARLARDANMNPKPFDREARPFKVPHVADEDAVFAEEVQNVRAFGTTDVLETYAELVAQKQQVQRQAGEATAEWWRCGAIQGKLIDGDGSTVLYNWFDEFEITEKEVFFDLDDDAFKFKPVTSEAIRHIQDSLGQTPYRYVLALCGDEFFDKMVVHADVEAAYQRWQAAQNGNSTGGQWFRENQVRAGMDNGGQGTRVPMFEFQGIMWANYRGFVGNQAFIPTDVCRLFPVGAPQVFAEIFAPAPFPETVNTIGQANYSRMMARHDGLGMDLHYEKNCLTICKRPGCLVKGTHGTSS